MFVEILIYITQNKINLLLTYSEPRQVFLYSRQVQIWKTPIKLKDVRVWASGLLVEIKKYKERVSDQLDMRVTREGFLEVVMFQLSPG